MKGKWLMYTTFLGTLAIAGAFTTDFFATIESGMLNEVGPVIVADVVALTSFLGLALVKYLDQDVKGRLVVVMNTLLFALLHLGLVIAKTDGTEIDGNLAVVTYVALLVPVVGLELVDYLKSLV